MWLVEVRVFSIMEPMEYCSYSEGSQLGFCSIWSYRRARQRAAREAAKANTSVQAPPGLDQPRSGHPIRGETRAGMVPASTVFLALSAMDRKIEELLVWTRSTTGASGTTAGEREHLTADRTAATIPAEAEVDGVSDFIGIWEPFIARSVWTLTQGPRYADIVANEDGAERASEGAFSGAWGGPLGIMGPSSRDARSFAVRLSVATWLRRAPHAPALQRAIAGHRAECSRYIDAFGLAILALAEKESSGDLNHFYFQALQEGRATRKSEEAIQSEPGVIDPGLESAEELALVLAAARDGNVALL